MHKFNLGESTNFKGLAGNQGQCFLISLWLRNPQLNLCLPLPGIKTIKRNEFIKGLYEIDFGLTILFCRIYGDPEYYRP